MKFNVTENIKYCLSHFTYLLISIYTYSSAWNLFMMSKQTEFVKKMIIWVILVADVYVLCYTVILHTFSKNIFIDISSESTVSLLFIYSELQV